MKQLCWLTLVLLSTNCAMARPTRTHSEDRVQLKFIADVNLKTGMTLGTTEIGGLSAAYYDSSTRELFALSDDKSEKAPARIHVFTLEIDESGDKPVIKIEPKRTITLRQANNQPFAKGSIDPEGLAPSLRGFYVSQEGNFSANPRIAPSVMEVSTEGKFIRQLPFPAKAIPEASGTPKQGTRVNAAFEGLSFHTESSELTPLIVAAESALVQDDTPADFTKGSLARLFCLNPSQLFAPREYIYPISEVERPDPKAEVIDRGISEILAIPRSFAPDFSFEPWVLVLERGTTLTHSTYRNQVDLFLTQLKDATDVSAMTTIAGAKYAPLNKSLVMSLHHSVSPFTEGYQSVDNLEAMAWGPRLKNGSPSLIILSDNNFNPGQRTQILVYEWRLR